MNPRNLTTALMVMAHTQDMDMDIVVETPVQPERRSEFGLLMDIQSASYALITAVARYDGSRGIAGFEGFYNELNRRQFDAAMTHMVEAIEAYRNA